MICDSLPRQGDQWPSSLLHVERVADSAMASVVASPERAAFPSARSGLVLPSSTRSGSSWPVSPRLLGNFSQAAVARRDAGRGIRATTAPSTPVSVAQATSNAGRPAHS